MHTGIVKWFNNAKGFGFILPEGGGGDIFAHYSSIDMDGYKTLKAGQLVSYETVNGPKGLHATNIQAISNGRSVSEDTATSVATTDKDQLETS
jgi:CspA family cold shock protein